MKKEHISDALNMLNDDIIEETNNVRTNAKPTRKWVKWGVVAACLCLAVTIAIPVLHHKGGPDTQDPVQNIAALEYNGKFYEAVKLPEVLEKYGLPPEITADMAGEHISYLKSDGGIGYKSTVSQTDIELYRYAPAVCDGVYVLRDGDTWYAALFCNFYQFDSNSSAMSIFSKRSASVSLWPKVKKSTLPVTPFLIFGANEKSSCFLCENSCSFLIFIYFNCYLFKFLSIHPCIWLSILK